MESGTSLGNLYAVNKKTKLAIHQYENALEILEHTDDFQVTITLYNALKQSPLRSQLKVKKVYGNYKLVVIYQISMYHAFIDRA